MGPALTHSSRPRDDRLSFFMVWASMLKVNAGLAAAVALCLSILSAEVANAQWTELCVVSTSEYHEGKVCQCPPGTNKVRNPQHDLSNIQNTKGIRNFTCVRAAKPVENFLVFFDFGQTELSPSAGKILDLVATMFKERGTTKIEIVGHTDTALVASLAKETSVARAEAVKAALVAKGIPASAITTRGEGKNRPLVPTGDGKKEPQNRRVEILLFK